MNRRRLIIKTLVVLALAGWRLGHAMPAEARTATTCGLITCSGTCSDATWFCQGCAFDCVEAPDGNAFGCPAGMYLIYCDNDS